MLLVVPLELFGSLPVLLLKQFEVVVDLLVDSGFQRIPPLVELLQLLLYIKDVLLASTGALAQERAVKTQVKEVVELLKGEEPGRRQFTPAWVRDCHRFHLGSRVLSELRKRNVFLGLRRLSSFV